MLLLPLLAAMFGHPITGRFGRAGFASPAKAQDNAGAILSTPDLSEFPSIQAFLDVHDAQGDFIHGLKAQDVTIIENGVERTVTALEELRAGVQVVWALNPGPSFAIQNAQAVSRDDLIRDALRRWANARLGSNIDDLSLLITGGPAASHTADPAQWLGALNSQAIEARTATPNLDTLFQAVSLASDSTPRPGMGRAVIFVTAPPEGPIEQSLENLAAQARESQIPIYIWIVASSGGLSTQSAQQLIALSRATGGHPFTFTGTEPIPEPEEILEPLRHIYRLEYRSGVSQGGRHEFSVQVQAGEGSVISPPRMFELDLQPPLPAFVSPPLQIERGPDPAAADPTADRPDGGPESQVQPLEVVFDFPDGRVRPLEYSALLVDGEIVAENLTPPFDRFSWDLSGYTGSGLHRLQVQARDQLGMIGQSAELPVQLLITAPADRPGGFQRNLPLISVLAALIAGALLVLVLIVSGQLRPRPLRAARRRRRSDPVTQPVQIYTEAPASRKAYWASRLHWPGAGAASRADAYLNPLPDPDSDNTLPPIPITSPEIIIGSDSTQATLLLDDASVDAVHARLVRLDDGSYRLADAGTIAGTWVNYTPVSSEGIRLEQGDLVHIGRIGFRFTLRKPAPVRKPVVIADREPPWDEPGEEEIE